MTTPPSAQAPASMDLLDLCSPIAAEHLSSFLGQDTVFVDVRAEDAYHKAHLEGALPLSLPTVLWRRFLRNREAPGSLHRHLLTDALACLKTPSPDTMVVLYDENTTSLHSLAEDAPLRVFAEYFAREKHTVCFIEGGFRAAQVHLASQVVASETSGMPVVMAAAAAASAATTSATTSATMPVCMSISAHFGRKRAVPSSELNWVHGFLAVGSERHAHDIPLLKSEGVTHILNLTHNPVLPAAQIEFHTLQLELRDTLSENLLAHLQTALEFIDSARACGGRVLVHCFAGVSRSVSVSIAYAMWAFDLTLDAAMDLIKSHRECASPNLNFIGQLMMFEKTLGRVAGSSSALSPSTAPATLTTTTTTTTTAAAMVVVAVTSAPAVPAVSERVPLCTPSPLPSLHMACTTAIARLNDAISIHA